MHGWLRYGLAAGIGLAILGSADRARAEVAITISDGKVSVDAKDATVRQILTEWARVGQTRIVNVERITGSPLTLSLVQVPEAEALDIVLRSVSGYLAAPRAVPLPNASRFDRIVVMPTSTPPRNVQPAPTQAAQSFQPPVAMSPDDVDIDDPGMPPGPNDGPPRGPFFPQYPAGAASANPNMPSRGPVFPQAGSPFPVGAPTPNPAMPGQVVEPPGQFPPGQFPATQFPPIQQFPGAPVRGVMPSGVSTPGMVIQPPPAQGIPDPQ
jgi:hypothetical protein